MDEQNEIDFNDIMMDIFLNGEERRPRLAAPSITSTDSGRSSEIIEFGMDVDDPDANVLYIQDNQQPHLVIQGVGIENINNEIENINNEIENNPAVDSGLGSSISRTRTSEFIPEVIAFYKPLSSPSNSDVKEEFSENKEDGDQNNYLIEELDEAEIHSERGDEIEDCLSSFDLALDRGYIDQAKYYYNYALANDLGFETKHVTKLKDTIPSEIAKKKNHQELNEKYCSPEFTILLAKMLELDFRTYLEHIEKNEFKKILEILEKKKVLNEPEKIIRKCLKSKKRRLALKSQTKDLINKQIQHYESFAAYINCTHKEAKLTKEIETCRKLLNTTERNARLVERLENAQNELNKHLQVSNM